MAVALFSATGLCAPRPKGATGPHLRHDSGADLRLDSGADLTAGSGGMCSDRIEVPGSGAGPGVDPPPPFAGSKGHAPESAAVGGPPTFLSSGDGQ